MQEIGFLPVNLSARLNYEENSSCTTACLRVAFVLPSFSSCFKLFYSKLRGFRKNIPQIINYPEVILSILARSAISANEQWLACIRMNLRTKLIIPSLS